MGDIKLFDLTGGMVRELQGSPVAVEKSLQTLIETHLETFLGIRFVASEYVTGKTHGGRIDTLGLDENGFPVIIEYKRALNENVINQGLYYVTWLLDHKAEFEKIVSKKFGYREAEKVNWQSPRLLCIASDFTKYDEPVVKLIPHSVELIRYRRYGKTHLLLERVNATEPVPQKDIGDPAVKTAGKDKASQYKTVSESLAQAPSLLQDLFGLVEAFAMALGDDIQKRETSYYYAYKRLKNFMCVEVHPKAHELLLFLKIDPDTVRLESGFTRDVRKVGHFGTGDLEVRISTSDDLERAKPLILKSYEIS